MLDGSFYQYFDSKEDLLSYIMETHMENINGIIEETLLHNKGDIFAVFIAIYDYMVNECMINEEMNFYKKVFENIKTSEDTLFSEKIKEHKRCRLEPYYHLINTEQLRIERQEELVLVLNILSTITKKAIVTSFKYPSKEQSRKDFVKEIDYLQYGMLKK